MASLSALERKEKKHKRELSKIEKEKKSHIAKAKEHVKANPHMLIWIFFIVAIVVAILFYFFVM